MAVRVVATLVTLLVAGVPSSRAHDRAQADDALEAAFTRESYRPGDIAVVRIWTPAERVRLQVLRSGTEATVTHDDDVMHGTPVARPRILERVRSGDVHRIHVGDWPSGLYFLRLNTRTLTGYAPFIVRPARLGRRPVALVLPTRTWQAYNFRDDDQDGEPDTWYAMRGSNVAGLGRPFLNRGVPPHFRRYDLRFLRWLHRTGREVDVLAQEDLDQVSGGELARAYRLILFPGHHEYVTTREYDALTAFRDRGGNLAFLSANNFFWRIDVRGTTMRRVAKWRDLGRPEAALIGVQYRANDRGGRRGPWLVRRTPASRWLFAGVELRNGREFSFGNVEIDATTRDSPPGIEVVAEIPNVLGPGLTAQMTYYETPAGAKVFAAGAFSLARNVYERSVRRLLANLWTRLALDHPPASAPARERGWRRAR